MTRTLDVYMGNVRAGILSCDVRKSRFEYHDSYLQSQGSTPLSLSLPLRPGRFEPSVVEPFLRGLLPDNAETLRRWALLASPHADENNAFSLLGSYGRDCAGAVQFFPSDVDEPLEAGPVDWLTDAEIGEQLEMLRADPDSWGFEGDDGRFSLGGAQAKFALLHENGRWGRGDDRARRLTPAHEDGPRCRSTGGRPSYGIA